MLFINPSINISLNTIINTFLNPFKINTFSLIPYSLTLTILTLTPYPSLPKNQKAPQQIRSYPASATRFWNELYFYGAKFIIMEWSLFCIYIVRLMEQGNRYKGLQKANYVSPHTCYT